MTGNHAHYITFEGGSTHCDCVSQSLQRPSLSLSPDLLQDSEVHLRVSAEVGAGEMAHQHHHEDQSRKVIT